MGIFNKRPPQPQYLFLWDVSKVVNFMRGIKDNEKLTIKLLTLKLAAEISFLDVTFIIFKPNFVVLHFSHVTIWFSRRKPLH